MDLDSKVMITNDNLDPLSGEPGAHPVGAGVGAAIGGTVAGAVTGSVAGPVGTVVGAAIGAVLGGLAGKGLAENIEPTREAAYWHETRPGRPPAAEPAPSYTDFGPAYAFAVGAFKRFPDRHFYEVEGELEHDWKAIRGEQSLSWDDARGAVKEAWDRLRASTQDTAQQSLI